ncbi:MAG TPA: hypothetical protein VFQ92_07345 [Blastocatellia bacterium]|nr:hypothetical protein [Blastocatellia bacterium]
MTKTLSVALELVLVASTLSLPDENSALWIETASVVCAGLTVSVAVRVTPPCDAEMVTAVDAATVCVVTVKVALVAPATTDTLAGTVATAVLLLDSATTTPPDGADPVNTTVPCEEPPPVTVVGLRASDERVTADGGGATGVTVVQGHCHSATAILGQ